MSPLADWLPPVRFTKSLRLRLLLVSILVEGLMLSLLVANGARLIRSHLMENTELRLEAQESSFNIALAGLLAARDYSSVQSVLDGWGGIPGITYMAVADASGRVVAARPPAQRKRRREASSRRSQEGANRNRANRWSR